MGTVIVFTAKYIYFPPVTWLFFLKKKGSLSCTKTYSQLTNTYGTVTPIVVVVIERKKVIKPLSPHQVSPSPFPSAVSLFLAGVGTTKPMGNCGRGRDKKQ